MKKLVLALLTCLVLFSMAACADNRNTADSNDSMASNSSDAANSSSEKQKYHIANVEFVSGNTWWNLAYKGMKEQAEYYGDVEVTTVGPQAVDPAEQTQLVEDLITKGVDAITIVPSDAVAMESVLKKAR